MMTKLTVLAPAKVNLILEVIGKRADGYHEIRSLMQTIGLYDVITFENSDHFTFSCSEQSLQSADNLVVRAIRLFKEKTGHPGNVSVQLTKRIPWAAGLGGGSSDAAVTLLALNEFWGGICSLADLMDIAAKLGSDAPFFISGGLALIEGRGDQVTRLPDLDQCWIVLLVPSLPVGDNKTGKIYARLTLSHYSNTHLSEELLNAMVLAKALDSRLVFNTFDAVAFDAFPGIEKYWKLFERLRGKNVHLSGSGPSLFSICSDKNEAEGLGILLSGHGLTAYVVPAIQSGGLIKA